MKIDSSMIAVSEFITTRPLPDVRLHVGGWNEAPSLLDVRAQEEFRSRRGYAAQAEAIADKRPAVCIHCGLRFSTEKEAHNCCQRQIDNRKEYLKRFALSEEQATRLKELFDDGRSLVYAKDDIRVSDYRIRPYWNTLRDDLMAELGYNEVKQYFHWRDQRAKELGRSLKKRDEGRFSSE